jgi:putative transposase
VFHDPPRTRNRVWQTDFSEFETTSGGIWRICAVIDYATKYCLAATVTPTARGVDALACLRMAVAEAQRLTQLDDLRGDRGPMHLVDADGAVIGTVPAPIAVVSDNGGPAFAARHSPRPSLATTRCDGTCGRGCGAPADQRRGRTILRHPKYEHLYRAIITDGDALAVELAAFRQTYNSRRPHQALADRTPRDAYLAHPTDKQ